MRGTPWLRVFVFLILPITNASYVPKWKPVYNMSLSTIMMPCNDSGWYNTEVTKGYGIVDFDWSNAKQLWCNTKPMDCEERLVTQAQMVKKASPDTKVWVYRNLVKALPWYTDVRVKITDPQYSGWFLKFKPEGPYHVPKCTGTKCSEFYHDQEQTPQHPHGDGSCKDECDCGSVPCGEYLWDHRNDSLRSYLINEYIGGAKWGLGNPVVSGFYLDDGWSNHADPKPSWAPKGYKQCDMWKTGGPTEEDYHCVVDMGLSHQDVLDIYAGWQKTISLVHKLIVENNAFAWQLFQGGPTNDIDKRKAECSSFLREACKPNNRWYKNALMMEWSKEGKHVTPLSAVQQDVAMFLLIRGDYAWLGYSWSGCSVAYQRPKEVDVDYGMPRGMCSETHDGSGVFTRKWSTGTVELDCNTWTAKLP